MPELTEPMLLTYVLIVVRLSTALVIMPMFGAVGVPPHTKVSLALFMGLILVPLAPAVELAPGLAPLLAAVALEALVGFAVGFAVVLVFQGLEAAGGLVGIQMGMGLGEILDPISGAQSNVLRRFYAMLAILIFFMVNAHHQVIVGLFATFDLVPLSSVNAADLDVTALIRLSGSLFIVAVRIALPVLAAVFITDLSLGVMARTRPQLNVLIVGLPVKIVVGLLVLFAALPATTSVMGFAFGNVLSDMTAVLTPSAQG